MQKRIVRSVVKKIASNDRIIAINLKAEPVNILIMQVYMPTSEYENDEVEKMYDTIEEILEEDGKGDTNNIILGDWNSAVGEESYIYIYIYIYIILKIIIFDVIKCNFPCSLVWGFPVYIIYTHYNIQGVPGGMCQTSGECSLG